MTVRRNVIESIGVALAAGVAIFLALLVPAAANAAPTKTFDGEGFSVKPDRLSSWTAFGGDDSDPVLISGRAGSPKEGLGPIEWQFWKRNKAVGKGAGWTGSCARPCKGSFPWDGANLRVTLYRKRDGHFTKMIVHARRNSATGENYLMKLAFRGDQWTVTSVEDGLRKFPSASATKDTVRPGVIGTTVRPKETMLYHSNSYAIRPSIVTGWIRDGRGEDLQMVGGPTGRPQGNWGSIDWQSWKKNKAVGVGNGWTLCGEAECGAGYPWDGSKVRITAYGTKKGHFTKMKIWAHSAGKLDENYLMKLRFIRPSAVLSWKVTSLDDGSH